jgi:hypothetical protein
LQRCTLRRPALQRTSLGLTRRRCTRRSPTRLTAGRTPRPRRCVAPPGRVAPPGTASQHVAEASQRRRNCVATQGSSRVPQNSADRAAVASRACTSHAVVHRRACNVASRPRRGASVCTACAATRHGMAWHGMASRVAPCRMTRRCHPHATRERVCARVPAVDLKTTVLVRLEFVSSPQCCFVFRYHRQEFVASPLDCGIPNSRPRYFCLACAARAARAHACVRACVRLCVRLCIRVRACVRASVCQPRRACACVLACV